MSAERPALRGAVVGAGYFARFHYDGWSRVDGVEIVACCDRDPTRLAEMGRQFGIAARFESVARMLDEVELDFIDVVTPPETHLELCELAAARGIAVMCQKPLAPTLDEARRIVDATSSVRFMVHENFRFQPWHREIKRLIESGAIGERLHSLTFRSRPGDGWGEDAYLGRQPYFRLMPRLLIHETGVHFIDTFRFLAGEVARVSCHLRRLNPVIAGEDCGLVVLEFTSGAVGVWDANRYNESSGGDPRYTFGEFLVEGSGGSIRLGLDGSMSLQPLGKAERSHPYTHGREGFAGDCCRATLAHFALGLASGAPFETDGRSYLRNLEIQEALYRAAAERRTIDV